jgi:hypothetical protein
MRPDVDVRSSVREPVRRDAWVAECVAGAGKEPAAVNEGHAREPDVSGCDDMSAVQCEAVAAGVGSDDDVPGCWVYSQTRGRNVLSDVVWLVTVSP